MTLGVGTLAYGIAAGTLAATALVFVLIAVQRPRSKGLFLAFGSFGLAVAANTVATVWLEKSGSIDEYADRLKLFGLTGLLSIVAIVALVQTWTGAISRPVAIVFLGASIVIAILQLALPDGLLATEITGLREVHLFGEPFVVHEASTSPWRPALDLYLLFTLALVGVAVWRGVRRGPRSEALVLAVGISLFVVVAQYDSLVDEGVVSTPYLAPFGAVLVAAVAAWHLARGMAATERQLAAQTTQLEATVIERTAALIDANRRLERQVEQQRTSARRLAALAEQFEAVNALALRHDADELERSLLGVLANLGNLLAADAVELRVAGADRSAEVPAEITWTAGGEPADDRADAPPTVEPIIIGSRWLGELAVQPADGEGLGAEEQRYIELTSDHLAGFLDRLELSDRIAATAVDAERHRIARELHDSVTQKLYSISFLAEAVPRQLETDPDRAGETVARMRQLLLSSLAELRTLLFELQPEALDTASLTTLVGQLTEMFSTDADLRVESRLGPVRSLPPAVKVSFYRIAQEALSNAVRHSGSDRVAVELGESSGTVALVVRDDGAGFDPGGAATGHGLGNMRERAASAGADLDIDAAPGVGATIALRWSEDRHGGPDERVSAGSAGEPR